MSAFPPQSVEVDEVIVENRRHESITRIEVVPDDKSAMNGQPVGDDPAISRSQAQWLSRQNLCTSRCPIESHLGLIKPSFWLIAIVAADRNELDGEPQFAELAMHESRRSLNGILSDREQVINILG
jgi:hypothetical protein